MSGLEGGASGAPVPPSTAAAPLAAAVGRGGGLAAIAAAATTAAVTEDVVMTGVVAALPSLAAPAAAAEHGRDSLGAESVGVVPAPPPPARQRRDDFGLSALAEAGAVAATTTPPAPVAGGLGGAAFDLGMLAAAATASASSGSNVGKHSAAAAAALLGVGGHGAVGGGRVGVSGVPHPFATKEPVLAGLPSVSGAAGAASFLDSLSEEQRRVRTRHLPGIDGFRVLGRGEVKRDLAQARAALRALARGNSGGSVSSSGSGGRPKRRGSNAKDTEGSPADENKMDVDDVDVGTPGLSDVDTASDSGTGGGKSKKPSATTDNDDAAPDAFVPPHPDYVTTLTGGGGGPAAASDGDAGADSSPAPPPPPAEKRSKRGGGSKKAGATAAAADLASSSAAAATSSANDGAGQGPLYPHVVETISAFDPPRPPESVAPKKKHRLLRWERNPSSVETDLTSYRKTVRRTREELHRAEADGERIESTGAHLRNHFLGHLRELGVEGGMLERELGRVREVCVDRSGDTIALIRPRGKGKERGDVMRDVLAGLIEPTTASANGASAGKADAFVLNGDAFEGAGGTDGEGDGGAWCVAGIGGVSADVDVPTNDDGESGGGEGGVPSIARGWLLPGDRVATPVGEGTVLHVYGPSALDADEPPPPEGAVHGQQQEGKKGKPAKGVAPKAKPAAPLIGGKKATSASAAAASKQQVHGFGAPAAKPGGTPKGGRGVSPKGGKKGSPAAKKTAASPSKKLTTPKGGKKASPASAAAKGTKKGKTEAEPPAPPSASEPVPTHGSKTDAAAPAFLAARVLVKTPTGSGYFSPDSLHVLENPAEYSDAQLLGRWKKMVETAGEVGGCVDTVGMDGAWGSSSSPAKEDGASEEASKNAEGATPTSSSEAAPAPVAVATHHSTAPPENSEAEKPPRRLDSRNRNRTLPVGASMLRSPGLMGYLLSDAAPDVLDANMEPALFGGYGVLAREGNPGVPPDLRAWEAQRAEVMTLRGRALQLRNELYRQRRIRILNERSRISGRERAERVETLLGEMKSDLASLKERLSDELLELGVNGDKARELLGLYMRDADSLASTRSSSGEGSGSGSSEESEEEEGEEYEGGAGEDEEAAAPLAAGEKRARSEDDSTGGDQAAAKRPATTEFSRQ